MATDTIVTLARSWIGTPYVHQASVKGAGCDCLGLLRGVWRELNGAEPEPPPPYTPDWAEATGQETLYMACTRHLTEIDPGALAPGDVALFRMTAGGPAKHCGIVAGHRLVPHGLETCGPHSHLTLIHARQHRRVVEESFGAFWRHHLACAFRF
jgi:NlpC/P60 family putative phage cell wall peptidase